MEKTLYFIWHTLTSAKQTKYLVKKLVTEKNDVQLIYVYGDDNIGGLTKSVKKTMFVVKKIERLTDLYEFSYYSKEFLFPPLKKNWNLSDWNIWIEWKNIDQYQKYPDKTNWWNYWNSFIFCLFVCMCIVNNQSFFRIYSSVN